MREYHQTTEPPTENQIVEANFQGNHIVEEDFAEGGQTHLGDHNWQADLEDRM